jgi:hypothetical protein
LAPPPKDFNDSHATTAAGTGWEPIEGLWCFGRLWWRSRGKQFAGTRYVGLAGGTGEQAVMPDAVEAMRQDMEQEAADEFVRCERHHALPLGTIASVVFVAKGDAGLVEGDQTLI